MSLFEKATSGDRLGTLQELRDFLAEQLQTCESKRDIAALAGRFQSVLEEIAELEPKKAEGDGIDEIAERRASRRAKPTKSPARTERSS